MKNVEESNYFTPMRIGSTKKKLMTNMNSRRTILALSFVIGCILLTTGCTSQPSGINKTGNENSIKDPWRPVPTLDPNSTPYIPGGNQISISDFRGFLEKWNDKMHWGFSSQQLENFNVTLHKGILKKYQTNPYYPSIEIPDLKPFCLEVGDAIGLSKNQSEIFATAADDDLRRAKIESDLPLPTP